jgi:hypothetical protein
MLFSFTQCFYNLVASHRYSHRSLIAHKASVCGKAPLIVAVQKLETKDRLCALEIVTI